MFECNMSIASIIKAESVEFLPYVYVNCCMGSSENLCKMAFQEFIELEVQSPYTLLMLDVPNLAISSKIIETLCGEIFSPSNKTANFFWLRFTTS